MADPQYREKGQSDQFYPGGAIEALPICFALKVRLFDDVKKYRASLPPLTMEQDETGGTTNEHDWTNREFESIRTVIQKERDCPDGFTPWKPYFTPKEHREMLDRQWMLEREDRRDQAARRLRFAEFAVAIIAVVLIVVAAFIERGGQPIIQIITNEVPTVVIDPTPTPIPSSPTPDRADSRNGATE